MEARTRFRLSSGLQLLHRVWERTAFSVRCTALLRMHRCTSKLSDFVIHGCVCPTSPNKTSGRFHFKNRLPSSTALFVWCCENKVCAKNFLVSLHSLTHSFLTSPWVAQPVLNNLRTLLRSRRWISHTFLHISSKNVKNKFDLTPNEGSLSFIDNKITWQVITSRKVITKNTNFSG